MKDHHSSAESLDIGYGKCPEFVCVDGLIVSRESGDSWRDSRRGSTSDWRPVGREDSADWRDDQIHTDTEQSFVSIQGTLTTLR